MRFCLLLAALCALLPSSARASTLYAAASRQGSGTAGDLHTVELDPGDAISGSSFLGSASDDPIVGLAFDGAGRLFATTRPLDAGPSELLHVDPQSGMTLTSWTLDVALSDLRFEPGSDLLFGVSTTESACAFCLYEVSTTDGGTTERGAIDATQVGGIAFAADGTLYATTTFPTFELLVLDPADGGVVDRAPTGLAVVRFDGLAVRPEDGVFFATRGGGSAEIYRGVVGADLSQQWALVGGAALGFNTGDLAFRVPEPQAGSALLMALVALGLARRCLSA